MFGLIAIINDYTLMGQAKVICCSFTAVGHVVTGLIVGTIMVSAMI
jgi:hypothetical protein